MDEAETGKGAAARHALALLEGDRQKDYGHPRDDFARVVALFEVMTGIRLAVEDVPLFMMAIKLSRERHRAKPDNMVDVIGYASIRAHLLAGAAPREASAVAGVDGDDDAELRGMTPGQRLVRALEEALAWIRAEGLEDKGLYCAGRGESVPWLAAAAECVEEHLLKFDGLLDGPGDMEHYVFQGLRQARGKG